jgi:uncharacterized membrane protein YkoI
MRKLLFTILLALSATTTGTGLAQDLDHDDALHLRESGKILPLEQILDKAQQYHQGRVLEVELEKKRGLLVYEIELLDANGVVWEMKLNAVNGELVSEEKEN